MAVKVSELQNVKETTPDLGYVWSNRDLITVYIICGGGEIPAAYYGQPSTGHYDITLCNRALSGFASKITLDEIVIKTALRDWGPEEYEYGFKQCPRCAKVRSFEDAWQERCETIARQESEAKAQKVAEEAARDAELARVQATYTDGAYNLRLPEHRKDRVLEIRKGEVVLAWVDLFAWSSSDKTVEDLMAHEGNDELVERLQALVDAAEVGRRLAVFQEGDGADG